MTIINDEQLAPDRLSALGFLDDALTVFVHARLRAIKRGLFGVVPKLIALWSMLRWERKLGVAIIEGCCADRWWLEKDIERVLDSHAIEPGQRVFDFAPLGELVPASRAEAVLMGCEYVGTEHLALALSKDTDPVVKRIMRKHYLTYDRLRYELRRVLGEVEENDL